MFKNAIIFVTGAAIGTISYRFLVKMSEVVVDTVAS
jgi:hypothetical protein